MSLAHPQQEPIRLTVGQIAVTDTQVHTPIGAYPLRGTTWTVSNQTFVTSSIPGWAIVLAIVFFIFCLLGLLFLLVKERRISGAVQDHVGKRRICNRNAGSACHGTGGGRTAYRRARWLSGVDDAVRAGFALFR